MPVIETDLPALNGSHEESHTARGASWPRASVTWLSILFYYLLLTCVHLFDHFPHYPHLLPPLAKTLLPPETPLLHVCFLFPMHYVVCISFGGGGIINLSKGNLPVAIPPGI